MLWVTPFVLHLSLPCPGAVGGEKVCCTHKLYWPEIPLVRECDLLLLPVPASPCQSRRRGLTLKPTPWRLPSVKQQLFGGECRHGGITASSLCASVCLYVSLRVWHVKVVVRSAAFLGFSDLEPSCSYIALLPSSSGVPSPFQGQLTRHSREKPPGQVRFS